MIKKIYETTWAGKKLVAEFNDLVENANGSVLLTYGETVVLVTAVMGKTQTGMNFFPLSVEFEEKFYAAGEILGSRFMRREGKPSEEAILSARIVDRTIRPLFPPHLNCEVQVVVTVLAIGADDPDILGVLGASLALGVSDIPWNGPVGVVRVNKEIGTGKILCNPSYQERNQKNTLLEVLACGKAGGINMIETAALECSEHDVIELLKLAEQEHQTLETFQQSIISEIGKSKKTITAPVIPEGLQSFFETTYEHKLTATLFSNQPGKSHLETCKEEFLSDVMAEGVAEQNIASIFFDEAINRALHKGAVIEKRRADGRAPEKIRPLFAQAGGISPVLHGSGIFYRGGTKIFSALTLGGPDEAQYLDTVEEHNTKKQFLHHYNFPPFSVGETGRVGGFNRRMIGHGALAEKALSPVIPSIESFPYTIRVVSETLSSNGSSSMGSVCAASLALMDGGVPIKRAVAGIASGVMIWENDYTLLTDIQGPEDEHGDMDFKVAGTTEGITAIQMDVKVSAIPLGILVEALEAAKNARLEILSTMQEVISNPRQTISPRAPHIVTLQILPEQIGLVIGAGGKTINAIKTESGVSEITIEDNGDVFITGKIDTTSIAVERIRTLTRRFSVGEHVTATITKITTFGAFATLDTVHEGLIHISEIASFRIENVADYLKVGDIVPAVVSKLDDGKIGLSIKQANPDFFKQQLT